MKHLFFAALLLFSSFGFSQDSSGIYVPTVLSSSNSGIVTAYHSHFIRVGSQVIVYGAVYCVEPFITSVGSSVQISLPVATNMDSISFDDIQASISIYQNGQQFKNLGFVANIGGGVFLFWKSVGQFPANIYYSFSYTVK